MKKNNILQKRILGFMVLICVMVTFLVPVAAANDEVTVLIPNYTAAYCASTEGSSLAIAGDGSTIIANGDWAEYTVTIPKAGKYSVSLKEANNGINKGVYSVSVNGESKLVNKEGVASESYVSFTLGEISFEESGNYTLRLSKSEGYWALGESITLTYTGDVEYKVTVNVPQDYTSAYCASDEGNSLQIAADGGTLFQNGDWAEYTITIPKAGKYSVSLYELNGSGADPVYSVAVNGESKLINRTGAKSNGDWVSFTLGEISFAEKGSYTVKLSKSSGYWAYLQTMTFTYTGLDIEIDSASYKNAYYSAEGTSTLPTGEGYPMINNGDWAEYEVDVLKEGKYAVYVTEAKDPSSPSVYSVSIDGKVKLKDKEGIGSGSYVSFTLGDVNFAKSGTHTVKLSKSSGYWSIVKNITLKYLGDVDTTVTVDVQKDYKDAYCASTGGNTLAVAADGETMFSDNDWAKYEVEILKAGKYSVGFYEVNGGSVPVYSISVDGAAKILNKEGAGSVNFAYVSFTLGEISFTESGTYTIKISKSSGYWAYLKTMTFTFLSEEPQVTLYNSESVSDANKVSGIKEGTMTAAVKLPSAKKGENVTVIFAIYSGNKLYKANAETKTVGDEAIPVKLSGIEEGTYTYKILVWNNLEKIVPLYAVAK